MTSSKYGQAMGDQVELIAGREGLTVVANESISDDTFATPPADLEASGADCFLFGGFTPNGAAEVFAAVGAAVPNLTMFGADAIAESAFTQDLDPELAARTFITNPTLPAEHYPDVAHVFFEAFESEYGHAPEPYAIYGYEAMNVALLAIERAGDAASADAAGRAAVVAQFFQVEDRESVLGTYSIDENGDTTLSDFGGYTIADGELVFDAMITAVAAVPTSTSPTFAVEEPFPNGVYETTPSAEAWIAAGVPEEAGIAHRITFEDGRFDDQCIFPDGAVEPCWAGGTYRDVGDHEVELGDGRGFSILLRWRLEGDTLTFEMDPDEGEVGDRIVFTSSPWTRVG